MKKLIFITAIIFFAFQVNAQKKISELPAATSADTADYFVVVQSGSTKSLKNKYLMDQVSDTADVDVAVKKCVVGSFAYSGQVCIHVQRIYVHESIFELFSNKFVQQVNQLKVGSPEEIDTDISGMIDALLMGGEPVIKQPENLANPCGK